MKLFLFFGKDPVALGIEKESEVLIVELGGVGDWAPEPPPLPPLCMCAVCTGRRRARKVWADLLRQACYQARKMDVCRIGMLVCLVGMLVCLVGMIATCS